MGRDEVTILEVPEIRIASAADKPCELYLDHGSARPSVTQGHHPKPVYMQNEVYGKIVYGGVIYLCGTCHDNVHAWLYFLTGKRRRPDPDPPPRARAMAREAYDWYIEAKAAAGAS